MNEYHNIYIIKLVAKLPIRVVSVRACRELQIKKSLFNSISRLSHGKAVLLEMTVFSKINLTTTLLLTFLLFCSNCSVSKSNPNIPLQLLLLRASQSKTDIPSGFLVKLPVGLGFNSSTGISNSITSSNLNGWDQVRLIPTFLKQVTGTCYFTTDKHGLTQRWL